MQLLAVEQAMQPAKKWQERIRSSESWKTFIFQVIGTSTQMIKMLKWSNGSTTSRRVSLDAIVRASCGTLPTASIVSLPTSTEYVDFAFKNPDSSLKSLDGDYKLEAATPFHLNFKCVLYACLRAIAIV